MVVGQFYFCSLDGCRLVDNVKESAKDQKLFLEVTYIGKEHLCFTRQWRRPIRTRFLDADLRPSKIERVARLQRHFAVWENMLMAQ